MRSKCYFIILRVLVLSDLPGVFAQVPSPAHVLVVIEENHDYSQIIGSVASPHINALVADSNAALFTQSYALTHPSQPNYLMLFSGSNQGVADDNVPSGLPFTTANLGASLIAAGKTFCGYSEDLPSIGYSGATAGAYARKHNPWVNWQDSPTHGISATDNLPLTSFPVNYDSLPAVSFVIPDQNDDMHNGTDPSTISVGDTWLYNHISSFIQWAKSHNSLFILTFDEGTTTNQIVTLFDGPMVKHGVYAEQINHYTLLRTIEDMFRLLPAGESASASAITDCWSATTGVLHEGSSTPARAFLNQNYPNPFNPSTKIQFSIVNRQLTIVKVFDLLGTEVATLVNEVEEPGTYSVEFNGSKLSSGVYFYRLQTGDYAATKKLLLLR